MITKKLVFECEKCGFDNHIVLGIELDDLVLTHKNKRPYPKRRKYLDSRDDADLLSDFWTKKCQKRKKPKDDGKTPEQRSAAAKKAAATRKANLAKGRGDLNGADYR